MYKSPLSFICASMLFLSACAGGNVSADSAQGDYETTKKMVTDILKTEEGKKAINEVLAEEETQKNFVIEDKVIKDAVNEALTSDKGKEFWTKMFEDPKFVESFAKSLQKEHKEVIKGLMSDSEYQKQMLELLQNPEMEEQMQTVVTSQKFRGHLEKTIQETMESPLFKAQMIDALSKAIKEAGASGQEDSGGGEGGS